MKNGWINKNVKFKYFKIIKISKIISQRKLNKIRRNFVLTKIKKEKDTKLLQERKGEINKYKNNRMNTKKKYCEGAHGAVAKATGRGLPPRVDFKGFS